MLRVHLDTDIGGDTDDLCALALLLGSPDVELVGVTTVADTEGGRSASVRHALGLAGRADVPIASGAFGFLGIPQRAELQDARYWPGLTALPPSPPGRALDLLYTNAQSGATIIAIGPYTNLAVLETLRPGAFETPTSSPWAGIWACPKLACPSGVRPWTTTSRPTATPPQSSSSESTR